MAGIADDVDDFDEEIEVNEDDDLEEIDLDREKSDVNKGKKPGKFDPTKTENDVAEVLERFKAGCECQDETCFLGLNPEAVYRHRLNIADLTKSEHDLYMMGLMMACITDPNKTGRKDDGQRLRTQYVYHGRRVCLDAFLYLENCTRYQLKKIKKHLRVHGVTPLVHGNSRKVPHNTLSLDCYQIATKFVQDFIKEHEDKLKSKTGKHSQPHLPPEITRKNIHRAYKEYCKKTSQTVKVMGYSTFCKFIKKQFPKVKFAKFEVVRPQQTVSTNGELGGTTTTIKVTKTVTAPATSTVTGDPNQKQIVLPQKRVKKNVTTTSPIKIQKVTLTNLNNSDNEKLIQSENVVIVAPNNESKNLIYQNIKGETDLIIDDSNISSAS